MRSTPLVLLHGFTGGPASFDATRLHLHTYSSSGIFAPYLVGHGPEWSCQRTFAEATSDTFDAEVSTLGEQLQSFGVSAANPCTLVGYSLGARLALGLLCAVPAWFHRCVLIGVNPGLGDATIRRVRLREDELRAEQLERQGLCAFLSSWQAQSLFDTQRNLPEEVLRHQDAVRRGNTAAGLAHCLRRTGLAAMPDYSPFLATIPSPVHLVVGQRDAKFRTIAEGMRLALRHCQLALIPNVGHNIPLEAPQLLAALLDALPEDNPP